MSDVILPDILVFEWDEGNSFKSYFKHKVTIKEQEEAFFDKKKQTVKDRKHSGVENRFLLFAKTKKKRALIIAFTIRSGRIRCISARQMNRKEVEFYEKTLKMA